MIRIERTTSSNKDFIELVKLLDSDLKIRDGDDHEFYNQFNSIEQIKNVVIAYENRAPIGCGAFKFYKEATVEIKRMYTLPIYRSRGIASKLLGDLEKWAFDLNYKKCILETGVNQPEAIGLYYKNGYQLISNYGQYQGVKDSRCFSKWL